MKNEVILKDDEIWMIDDDVNKDILSIRNILNEIYNI